MEPVDPNKYWIVIETQVIEGELYTTKTKKWFDEKNQLVEKILSKERK